MQDFTFKFFPVMESSRFDIQAQFIDQGILRRGLVSFYYKDRYYELVKVVGAERLGKVDLLIDSGAFTVMTKGIAVDIDAYIAYLHEVKNANLWKTLYAFNLDVIPESDKELSLRPTLSSTKINLAAEKSWDNYLYICKKGIDFVIPVFHYGENVQWLRRMVEYGCQYIALGGMAGRMKSKTDKRAGIKEVFDDLARFGYQGKVHMLGLSSGDQACSYRWYSGDSTLAKRYSYGRIDLFVPEYASKIIAVGVSPVRPEQLRFHTSYDTAALLSPERFGELMSLIGMKNEVKWEELGEPTARAYNLRWEICLRSWVTFEDWINVKRCELGRFEIYNLGSQKSFLPDVLPGYSPDEE